MIFFRLITLVVLGLMINRLSAFILRLSKICKYSKRYETTTMVQLNSKDYGVSFTGAGLLTPFHLGVSAYLSDEIKLIKDNTMLAGSSGGALASVTTALKVNNNEALAACDYIAKECSTKGTRLTLRLALDEVLNNVLPSNAADILNNRPATCSLSYTEVFPKIKSYTINKFRDKVDLIDCLRASCNIPFYFNGNSLTVDVRNGGGIDGFFSHQINRFGAPSIPTPYEIVVCPIKPSTVGLNPSPLLLRQSKSKSKQTESLEPMSQQFMKDLQNLDFQNIKETVKENFKKQTSEFTNSFQNYMNENYDMKNNQIMNGFTDNASSNNDINNNDINNFDDIISQEIDIISPALLSSDNWPFSTIQNIQLLVLPPTDAITYLVERHIESLAQIDAGNSKNNFNIARINKYPSAAVSESGMYSTMISDNSLNVFNSYKKIKAIKKFNNKNSASLVYTFVYNAGVLAAHKWFTNKQRRLLMNKQMNTS